MSSKAAYAIVALLCSSTVAPAVAQVQSTQGANSKRVATYAPVVDHHQHLLSPGGAAWLNRIPAPAEAIPPEVQTVLERRADHWNQPTVLRELYTDEAITLSDQEPRFLRGRAAVGQFLGTRFARSYQLTPRAYAQVGSMAYVAGYYTRGEGAQMRRVGYFDIQLAAQPDGSWGISAEIPTFPAPPPEPEIPAEKMIEYLDEAQIDRALILSVGYWFDSDNDLAPAAAYSRMMAENDWTAAQAAKFPKRLIAFCSFNPLKNHAVAELERCASSGKFRGVKLHFHSSGVDLKKSEHVERLRLVFAAANRVQLPIIAHVRTEDPYGEVEANVILNSILRTAPNIDVQIAHLWGGEAYSPAALATFAKAVSSGHSGTKRLFFDISDAAFAAGSSDTALKDIAQSIRSIGFSRILYGSDAPMEGHPTPAASWAAFRATIPLTDAEFRTIAQNVAPYARR